MSWHVLWLDFTWCDVMSRAVTSCHVAWRQLTWLRVMSRGVTLCSVVSHCVTWQHLVWECDVNIIQSNLTMTRGEGGRIFRRKTARSSIRRGFHYHTRCSTHQGLRMLCHFQVMTLFRYANGWNFMRGLQNIIKLCFSKQSWSTKHWPN